MKKLTKLALIPVALMLGVVSCGEDQQNPNPTPENPNEPNNPNPPEEPNTPGEPEKPELKIESLSDLMKNIDSFDSYTIDVTGTVSSYYQGEVELDKNISFAKDSYVYEEFIGEDKLSSGLINKDGYVGAFNANNDIVEPIGIRSSEYDDYHDMLINLSDMIDTPFLTYTRNTYNLEVSKYDDGTYVNQYDYLNFAILSNIMNLGSYQQMVTTCSLTFEEETKDLIVEMGGAISIATDTTPFVSRLDLEATIDFDAKGNEEIENHFKDYTFVEPTVDDEVKGMIDKIESGYMYENIKMSATDGSSLNGNIYSTEDYIVFDFSDKIADKIQGYAEKDGALYSVTPTATGPNFQKLFGQSELNQVNEEMGTDYTAIELGKVMFAQSLGIMVPEATTALDAPFLYKNNGRGTFMAGDSANLYGLRYDSDTFFNVGIVQGLVPAGYYLTYRNADKTSLGFGYYAYGNNKGSATAYSVELITMSSFGSRNKTMDILLSRL